MPNRLLNKINRETPIKIKPKQRLKNWVLKETFFKYLFTEMIILPIKPPVSHCGTIEMCQKPQLKFSLSSV